MLEQGTYQMETKVVMRLESTGSPIWLDEPSTLAKDDICASSCRTSELRHLNSRACGTEEPSLRFQ